MRLSLFVVVLLAALASCTGCPPPVVDAGPAQSDWKPPTTAPRPPTGGLPDDLRPPR